MKVNLGGQIRGTDCFGREKEINRIWNTLEKQSIMLTAPRRVGKTTIIYNLHDEPQNGWLPIFSDLEKCHSPEEFILDLLAKGRDKGLLNRTSQWFKQTLAKIESIGAGGFGMKLRQTPQGWKDLGRDIFQQFADNLDGRRLLLLLDEFPLMLANIINRSGQDNAKEVLHWARSIRQDGELGRQIRFIYTGSIGLETILDKLECHGAMNDVKNIVLDHFSPDLAKELARELLIGETLFPDSQSVPPSILDKFLDLSGPIPFFIQMLAAEMSRLFHEKSFPISVELISKAYQDGVMGRENRHYFEHYYDRLRHYYTPEEREAALVILAQIAQIDMVAKESLFQTYLMKTQDNDYEKFNNLMGLLEGDFYVEYDPGKQVYYFWSSVLRDWWRKYKL